jgi:hypothetical protein
VPAVSFSDSLLADLAFMASILAANLRSRSIYAIWRGPRMLSDGSTLVDFMSTTTAAGLLAYYGLIDSELTTPLRLQPFKLVVINITCNFTVQRKV